MNSSSSASAPHNPDPTPPPSGPARGAGPRTGEPPVGETGIPPGAAGFVASGQGSPRGDLRSIPDVLALLLVCGVVFFAYADRFDYIETEGLRAIVAAEMLERPGLTMPTVHHRPYVNKPPLYAWTTTMLVRGLGVPLDERIARLPSAVAATLLILTLYGAGTVWRGRDVGLAAAALALANVVVLDYGFRAELDMPFTFLMTATFLLLWPALTRTGVAAITAWLGAFLFATLAAFWKAPHSLIFMYLALIGWSYRNRTWRWIRNPGHLIGLAISMALLVTWLITVMGFAGGGKVGLAAGGEIRTRLIPDVSDLIKIPLYPFVTFLITVPASLFILVSVVTAWPRGASRGPGPTTDANTAPGSDARGGSGAPGVWKVVANGWRAWRDMISCDRFAGFLLACLVPNLVFLALAPAKSPRYTLPILPPLFLLAGYLAIRRPRPASVGTTNVSDAPDTVGPVNHPEDTSAAPGRFDPYDDVRRRLFFVLAGVGLVALVVASILPFMNTKTIGGVSLGGGKIYLTLALGCILPLAFVVMDRRLHTANRSLAGLLIVVVAFKPLMVDVWWPARVAADTQRPAAAAIDDIAPAGEPVFVLGRQEFPDTALYSHRIFRWIDRPEDATRWTDNPHPFFLMRENELKHPRHAETGLDVWPGFTECLRFQRVGRDVILFNLDLPAPAP